MELKIEVQVATLEELDEIIKGLKKIEEEHKCNCTLLEATLTTLYP